MKVLLDTNIIIHREASSIRNKGIGILFNWLDRLHFVKCVHPLTVEEIKKHRDPKTVHTMGIKLDHYNVLRTEAPVKPEIAALSKEVDKNVNDVNDTRLLNELANDRVDILISEDKIIHVKASRLGLANKVFRIETFLETVIAEHPEFVDYKTLAVKKEYFGKLDLSDPFFDSFRRDYEGFDRWFNGKSDEIAYICSEAGEMMAFLFLKVEGKTENYSDITPVFPRKKRLKIGTFKVTLNGFKLGERFLKIIFDNALKQKVDEIYVTIFDKTPEQVRLIQLLNEWGFEQWGTKASNTGDELVLVRNFERSFYKENPKLSFPYVSTNTDAYIVPIYPKYHTDLLPDSVLNTESPTNFIENQPHRNAISKVYICRSHEKKLKVGDNIIFYRTGETYPKIYSSVVSTIGVVESVITDIENEAEFIALCKKRSVFSDKELAEHWNWNSRSRPFIVNFLYTYSFPKRINLKQLLDLEVIPNINSVPRGFQKIPKDKFEAIIRETRTDESIIIH
ncbi:hypothetical protein GCM10023188_47320 [Pontibacter saemangeumensis]|uniref:N-acetyltransferase domain-containing protein n=1 Tax=Pontibacter saemangeumensis TaxID=1084525 RepID=A0ABP8M6U1_9BACT